MGIKFDKEYCVEENGNRIVKYADKEEIMDSILKRYHPELIDVADADSTSSAGYQPEIEDKEILG
jgi:type IV secretion system protein VirD4